MLYVKIRGKEGNVGNLNILKKTVKFNGKTIMLQYVSDMADHKGSKTITLIAEYNGRIARWQYYVDGKTDNPREYRMAVSSTLEHLGSPLTRFYIESLKDENIPILAALLCDDAVPTIEKLKNKLKSRIPQ